MERLKSKFLVLSYGLVKSLFPLVAEDVASGFAEGIGKFSVEGGEGGVRSEGKFEVGRVVGGELVQATQKEDFSSQPG